MAVAMFNPSGVSIRQMGSAETFGERLGRWRDRRGLSQKELGKLIGKDRSTIARWEEDAFEDIGGGAVRALAQALELTFEYLAEPLDWLPENPSQRNLTAMIHEAIWDLTDYSEEEKHSIAMTFTTMLRLKPATQPSAKTVRT